MERLKLSDKTYPSNLKNISDPPETLFIKGNLLPEDDLAIAVVGSRKMTDYGKEICEKFTKALVQANITIVSGLAYGVDTVAHKTALAAGGRTIAVLGSGLDIIYPRENKPLADMIARNGCLVSEFTEGTKPLPKNFLARNRIVSGLSIGILVIEGEKKSGTLSTTNHAANQGRDVFAIPGRVDSPTSYAPNFLIKNGAFLVQEPEDILDIVL